MNPELTQDIVAVARGQAERITVPGQWTVRLEGSRVIVELKQGARCQ